MEWFSWFKRTYLRYHLQRLLTKAHVGATALRKEVSKTGLVIVNPKETTAKHYMVVELGKKKT
jgi:hypothetical protein